MTDFISQDCSNETAKSPKFTKVYDKGLQRMMDLVKDDPNAARLWAFLVRKAGYDNAVVVSMAVLGEELGLSRRCLHNKVRYLEEVGALVVGKIGTGSVYILNHEEVWKTAEEFKNYHQISVQALLGKAENKHLPKRLTHLVDGGKRSK